MNEIDRAIKLSVKRLILTELAIVFFMNTVMILISYYHDMELLNRHFVVVSISLFVGLILRVFFVSASIRSNILMVKSNQIYLNNHPASLRLITPLMGYKSVIIRSSEGSFNFAFKVNKFMTSRSGWDFLISKCSTSENDVG
ncbi:hypothetical protein [Vibrio vulnificus]|uniref:hypothetical protein n=1 Tax=Vibrio vulnificus TaxID=672 RepID=UPI000CD16595|nr:hypothetical protein [Vibrio vulnificus]EGQ7833869.1 hypothetical protein [Vibrio vulnificus]EKO5200365.1 hypothetical protein [Vibrio vulnificus]ELV8634682.1 hypothetical protein [Vibrio vulnificus]MCA3907374.1 hypothetical protein [Vibrio vulnificus]POC05779.1 hypothetical protein CRN39_16690 [Vibrio vulnificus]